MTTIRATCPECGEVDLTPEMIHLTVVRSEDAAVGPDSYYSFRCPGCEDAVDKPADERIAHLLTTGGVDVTIHEGGDIDQEFASFASLPAHPESPPGGPPLTPDDLIDLHFLLATEGWFEQLLQTV